MKITELDYYMKTWIAYCTIYIVVENSAGKELFKKRYNSTGPSGFSRVFASGVFAMKYTIRQSTHIALETIFKNFVEDVHAAYKDWN